MRIEISRRKRPLRGAQAGEINAVTNRTVRSRGNVYVDQRDVLTGQPEADGLDLLGSVYW